MGPGSTVDAIVMLALVGTACGLGFVAFLVGVLLWHRKRWIPGVALVVLGVLLVLMPIALLTTRRAEVAEEYSLAVDLSRPENLSWVPEEIRWLRRSDEGRYFSIRGRIELQLELPDGTFYQARADRMLVATDGREIRQLEFDLPGAMVPEDAMEFALREASWWGSSPTGSMDLAELVEWIRAGREAAERVKSFGVPRERFAVEIRFERGVSAEGPSYTVAYVVRLTGASGEALTARSGLRPCRAPARRI